MLDMDLENDGSSWGKIGYVLCLEHCVIWLRDQDTNKIGAEVFGDLWNVVLEENGEDEMARESN